MNELDETVKIFEELNRSIKELQDIVRKVVYLPEIATSLQNDLEELEKRMNLESIVMS